MSEDGTWPWFAVRVKPRWEKEAARNLRCKGYTELLPLYIRRNQWSDRMKQVELPLFPGYLFATFDPRRPLQVLTTPGVLSIVCFAKTPVPLEQSEVDALRAVMHSGLPREPWTYLQNGEAVRIIAGPLKGTEGVVCSSDSPDRLILGVTLLQRAISVRVKPEWIEFGRRAGRAGGADETSTRLCPPNHDGKCDPGGVDCA